MRKEESNQTQHITPHITHHSGSGIILTISSMLYQNIILLLAFGFIATSIIEKPCLHKGCKLAGGLTLKQYKTLKASHRELKVKNKYNRKPLITVLQWNILYDRVQNSIDSWVFRKPHVCNYINQLKPDVIALQEVLANQLSELCQCLPGYKVFGQPIDRSVPNPQYNPILVNTKSSLKLKVVRNGTFWLSETPEKEASRFASSKEPRTCSWVKLRRENYPGHTQEPIYVANTHLTWRSMQTATQQVRALMTHLKDKIIKPQQCPRIILTGDFNWESNSTVYKETKYGFGFSNTMEDALLKYPALTALPPYPGLVDYIWQTGFNGVLSATLMDERPDNQRYMSDHRPVIAVLK